MWQGLKKVLPFVAVTGVGYLGNRVLKEFRFKDIVENNQSFIVYSPVGEDLTEQLVGELQVLNTDQGFRPSAYGLMVEMSSTGVSFVKKFKSDVFVSALEVKERLGKWIKFHICPYVTINSREELLKLLKSRKKNAFLDSFVLFYAPFGEEDREQDLESALLHLYYKESLNKKLTSSASSYLHLVRVTDPVLADALKIDQIPVFLRISHQDGIFSSPEFRIYYQEPRETKKYLKKRLNNCLDVDEHEIQLDNQIYFDWFELEKDSDGQSVNFSKVFEEIMEVNPLIFPLFNMKQLILCEPELNKLSQKEKVKILVVSLKVDKVDRSSVNAVHLAYELKLVQFAMSNSDVRVFMGHPEILYRLPFKDLAIYHSENTEMRLFTLNKGKVVSSQLVNEYIELEKMIRSDEINVESSPVQLKQNAETLNVEKFNKKILNRTDRCAFVMNCAKNSSACVACEEGFQKAAGLSKTCEFYKYYVSNQNPKYRGPSLTPKFYLFKPGKTVPVIYEHRVHGLEPTNFLDFIDKNLE